MCVVLCYLECASRPVHLRICSGAVAVGTGAAGNAGQHRGEGRRGESLATVIKATISCFCMHDKTHFQENSNDTYTGLKPIQLRYATALQLLFNLYITRQVIMKTFLFTMAAWQVAEAF